MTGTSGVWNDADLRRFKASLDHPVVDGDGHLLESMPLLLEYVRDQDGPEVVGRLLAELRTRPLITLGDARRGEARGGWWGVTNDATDLATAMLPGLYAERMEEIGIDVAVVYPTIGLALVTMPDPDLRLVACRALNRMLADLTRPFADRLVAAAAIPMHTPGEAVAEMRFAIERLGLRAIMFPPGVARPVPAYPDAFPAAATVDRYGIDSAYDYDPVWKSCCQLGVAAVFHGGVGLRYLDCGRRSPSSFMFNHIGGQAYQQQEVAKALLLGGVARRFPGLHFGFLEGGAAWAAELHGALTSRWTKRSSAGLGAYDPALINHERLGQLVRRYGPRDSQGRLRPMVPPGSDQPAGDWIRDEFADAGSGPLEPFTDAFRRFYFGCEADDLGAVTAMKPSASAAPRFNAFFSSDIGHWDVSDIHSVLLETRELCGHGGLDRDDYRRFTFANAVALHGGPSSRLFLGTPLGTPSTPAGGRLPRLTREAGAF